MKGIISHLNKAFENRVRLGIMSILLVNDEVDFNRIKELLDVSDGNLASHVGALDRAEYLTIEKKFIGKKTNTTYKVTKLGKAAFEQHLAALEKLLNL
jgi:DNA-binding transcriptional ArsR family regulator